MLKIRFQRVGRKNRPHFRLVLADSKSAAGKKAKEILGWKDPIKHTEKIEAERVKYWISVGAQVSDTAHNFLVKHGVISGSKIAVHKRAKKDAKSSGEAGTVSAPASSVVAPAVAEEATAQKEEKPAEIAVEQTAV